MATDPILDCANLTTAPSAYPDTTAVKFIITTAVLAVINLFVVCGNSLVIAAVITSRKLRTVTNMFIVSLACADLLLGTLILPLSIAYEVLKVWIFGHFLCSVWLAIDVCMSTASILNLCAISLDRYLAITQPIKYPNLMSHKRAKFLIGAVWVLAFIICFPPLIGWNDPNAPLTETDEEMMKNQTALLLDLFEYGWNSTLSPAEMSSGANCSVTPTDTGEKCQLVETRGYRIYSALGSFYIPMFVMAFFYLRIYLAAVKTAESLRRGVLTTKMREEAPSSEDTVLRVHRGGPSKRPQTSNSSKSDCYIRISNGAPKLEMNVDHRCVENRPSKRRHSSDLSTGENEGKASMSTRDECSFSYSKPSCLSKQTRRIHRTQSSQSSAVIESPERYPMTTLAVSHDTIRRHSSSVLDDTPSRTGTQSVSKRSHLIVKGGKKNLKPQIRKFKRETKAAKTLAIIVGAFILCWLPFFTIYLIGAFCEECIPPIVFSVLFWLGYCNSAINPFVYALCSRDFRFAFKRILCWFKSRPATLYITPGYSMASGAHQVQSQYRDSESISES